MAEIAQHVVDTALMWCVELSNPDGDFTRMSFAEFMEAHGTPAAKRPDDRSGLVRLLRSTHAAGARRLRRVGDVGILQTIRRFDGETGTRLAWLHHGIAHEEYHRGQLALYVRLLGRTPALTRLIAGA